MIFYFSGTGNTLWAARQIAEATGERLVSIAEALADKQAYELQPNERIGFCFPVHGWRPPFIVRDFIRGLQLKFQGTQKQKSETKEDSSEAKELKNLKTKELKNSKPYTYAFATCGDDVGETFELLDSDLAEIGLKTDSQYSIIMPESYVGMPLIDFVDKPQRRDEKLLRAKAAMAEVVPMIVERRCGVRRVNESRWPRINSRVIGAYFLKKMVTDEPFVVSADACTRCGLCAKVCPVGNIKGGASLAPEWAHNGLCTTCFSCYHHCPQHAIEWGRRTVGRGQYYFQRLP